MIKKKIRSNLERVHSSIADACERAGRRNNVQLVAVTKYAELDWVKALIELDQVELGESRPQQLAQRARELPTNIRWHLIGHLQRNKVDLILPVTQLIHSVDSLRLLRKIDSAAQKRSDEASQASPASVLLEVNVSGEEAKDGFCCRELKNSWPEIRQLKHLSIRGLMTMAPRVDSVEETRPVFRALRDLRDELVDACSGDVALPELSMGMSRDFELAVEEGATIVRIGSTLYDGLQEARSG